jgi:hypothetical protein
LQNAIQGSIPVVVGGGDNVEEMTPGRKGTRLHEGSGD